MNEENEEDSRILSKEAAKIRTFEDIKASDKISRLVLDETMVESLKGILKFKNLKAVSFINTPLYEKKFVRLMVIIATEGKIEIINGVRVRAMEVHEAKNYPLITMNLIDRGWEVNEKMPTDDELMRLADKYDVDYYYYKHRVKEENENRVLALELIRKLGSVGLRIEEGPKMEENIIYAIKKLAKIISSIDGDIPESFIKKEQNIHNNEIITDETDYFSVNSFSNEYADSSEMEN